VCADDALATSKAEVEAGSRGDKWAIVDDLVTVGGRVYVSPGSPSLPAILSATHDIGHEGSEKTLDCMRADFFVPGACMVVRDFVQACTTCQRNKGEKLHPGACYSH
jgi:hypothetical protein